MSELIIYRASAGSGKTFQLTSLFVELLIRRPDNYRRILAITFTNKAAGEMSNRVLETLEKLAENPSESDHFKSLSEKLNLTETVIQSRARQALELILYNYGQLSIGTIDGFFQRILRAFAREAGLTSGFSIELDSDQVLNKVVDMLLLESANRPDWMNWLTEWIEIRMDEGKAWKQLSREIASMGKQLLREQVLAKVMVPGFELAPPERIRELNKTCWTIMKAYRSGLAEIKYELSEILEAASYTVEDFSHKYSSPVAHMLKDSGDDHKLGKYESTWAEDPELFVSKSTPKPKRSEIMALVRSGFHPLLIRYISHIESNQPEYRAAMAVRKHLYALGLAGALIETLNRYEEERKIFLIQQTNPFLNQITRDNPTPFLYEKTGGFYRHFLLDEFQDTSDLQWKNLMPLVANSLSEGGTSLVVGDVKQSIYRWRNSNWRLLHSQAASDLDAFGHSVVPLKQNFRSRQAILDFNNFLFPRLAESIISHLDGKVCEHGDQGTVKPDFSFIRDAYRDVDQTSGKQYEGGRVQVSFFEGSSEEYEDYLFEVLPLLIEDLQLNRGFGPDDIAFLVRARADGDRVSRLLGQHVEDHGAKPGVSYTVSSSDTFCIGKSSAIRLIIQSFRYLQDPLGDFHLNLLKWEWAYFEKENSGTRNNLAEDPVTTMVGLKADWARKSLKEVLGHLINLFELHRLENELAYLFSFGDLLDGYVDREGDDLGDFLDWWDQKGIELTLVMEPDPGSMQVITIHKAKGLQFPVVILPFPDWSIDIPALHQPVIWADTRNTPFDALPWIPVQHSPRIIGTCFSGEYFAELGEHALDQINLLYVANTRAEEALFIFSRVKEASDSRISSLLRDILIEETQEPSIYSHGNPDFTKSGRVKASSNTLRLNEFVYKLDPGNLPVKRNIQSEQIREGNMLHDLLSRIKVIEDLVTIRNQGNWSAEITSEEGERLLERVEWLLGDERVRSWFHADWRVLNERDLLMPHGGAKRPDRVMISEREAVVIDYKTGVPRSHHKDQVREYLSILHSMGYESVKGYLLYTDNVGIEEVLV